MHQSSTGTRNTVPLNCKQATVLASKSIDEKLKRHECLLLRWHLLICRPCRNYFSQIKQIKNLANLHQESLSGIYDEAKQRITEAIFEVEKSINKNS